MEDNQINSNLELNDTPPQSSNSLLIPGIASVVSHDLQEPLRTIIGFSDLLTQKNESILDAESLRYLDVITSSAYRMQTLLNDLLVFAKMEVPLTSLTPVNLKLPLLQSMRALSESIENTHAQISYDELPEISGDATLLTLLFQNILSNAMKFKSDCPPIIKISSSGDREKTIVIADNGIGIDMKYSQRIFSIFQRLHSRAEFEGSGMGLAICKRIMDSHRGSICLDSVPGAGSKFILTFRA